MVMCSFQRRHLATHLSNNNVSRESSGKRKSVWSSTRRTIYEASGYPLLALEATIESREELNSSYGGRKREFIDGFNKFCPWPLPPSPSTRENRNNPRRSLLDIDDVIAMCSLCGEFLPCSPLLRIGNTGKYEKARVTDSTKIGMSINKWTSSAEYIFLAVPPYTLWNTRKPRFFGAFHLVVVRTWRFKFDSISISFSGINWSNSSAFEMCRIKIIIFGRLRKKIKGKERVEWSIRPFLFNVCGEIMDIFMKRFFYSTNFQNRNDFLPFITSLAYSLVS